MSPHPMSADDPLVIAPLTAVSPDGEIRDLPRMIRHLALCESGLGVTDPDDPAVMGRLEAAYQRLRATLVEVLSTELRAELDRLVPALDAQARSGRELEVLTRQIVAWTRGVLAGTATVPVPTPTPQPAFPPPTGGYL